MFSLLYVDDEPGLLEIGKLFLENSGDFAVTTVLSGKEGLGQLAVQDFDAIVSDYQMPEMDGIDFLKAVRKSFGNIPFILFTGRGREEVVIEAINNGVDFYLQKGGDPKAQFAELAHKVRQAVNRRTAEAALLDSERRLADIINFLPDATFAIDPKGVVIAWNRAIERMTGVKKEQVLGKDHYEYSIPFYHERRPILIDLVLTDDPATAARYPYIKREGKTLFSETTIPHFNDGRGAALWFTASPLYDSRGNVVGAIESIREISEWKKAEVARRESEGFLNSVVENIPDMLFVKDAKDLRFVRFNKAGEELLGYAREDLYGKNDFDFFPKDEADFFAKKDREVLDNKQVMDIPEERIQTRSRGERILHTKKIPIRDETGNPVYLMGISEDITERKRAGEELARSSESLRRAELVAGLGHWEFDLETRDVYASDGARSIYGISDRHWIIEEVQKIPLPEYRQMLDEALRALIKENKPYDVEFRIRHPTDGKVVDIHSIAEYDPAANVVFGVIQDITERKRAEETLRESEQKYRTVFETTGTATVLIENDATISLANSEFERLSGYSRDEIENRKKWTEFVVKEDLDRMLAQHRQRRMDRQSALKHYEFRFVSRSGGIREIYITIDVIPGTTKSVASLLDITERKQAEYHLIAANQEYTNLLDQIQDVYYRSDKDGRLVKASQSWATLLGYDNVPECLGRSIADDFYVNPADRELFLEKINHDGKVTNYEVQLRRKDGTPVLVATNSHLSRDPAGNILGIEGTFRDITEKKQQEHILRTQLELGLALQNSRGMNETLDICLKAAIEISGLDAGGIYLIDEGSGSIDLSVSRNLGEDFVRLVSHYPVGSANAQIIAAGKPIYTKYASTGLVHTSVQEREGLQASAIIPITFKKRVTACLNIASHNLDEVPEYARIALETIAAQIGSAIERIRADIALVQSEERYRNVVEDQTEFISRFTPDGTHVFVNEAYCRYFGVRREEILGHRFSPKIPPEDQERVRRFFASLTPDHPVDTIEHRIIMPDGRICWQRWSDRAIFDLSGTVTEYLSVGRDVTEMKDAELSLQTAYEQLTASDEELRGQYEELARSEQRTRENEAKFRAIIDQSLQFIGLMTPDGILLEANRTALEFAGIPESAVINRPFWETPWWSHSAELRERLKDAIKRAASGETVRFETYHPTADGHYIIVDFSVKPVVDSTGKILFLIPEGRDITELKNIEAALRQRTGDLDNRNRLISTLLDTVPIGIFMVEAPSGKPIITNREATRLLGRGILPDATEKNLAEVYEAYRTGTSERYPTTEMPIVRGINGESSHIDDMMVVRPDGIRVQLEIFGNPVVDSQGRIIASLVSFLDISERKRTEEALQAAQEKYAKAFLAGPDAITISELDSGKFVEVNDAATALFGYTRDELIGKSATELGIWLKEEDRADFIDQLVKYGRVHEYEVREKRKSGEVFDALVNAVTLTIGGRKFFISIVRDITERKQTEQTIAEINKKINLLTRITRHDVANQISILRGYAMIAMLKKPDPVVLGLLEKIDKTVSTIAQQIEFTKAYQELGMHAPGWHRIREIIAQQKTDDISVSCTCEAEVFSDPMIEKVFFNLIDNASRHGERVTTITVSCRPKPDSLVIIVEDNGIGVPSHLKERIFEEGYGQHTGFGLFFARVVLAITGITIHETGTHGKGARFEITVPKDGYRFAP